MTKSVLEEHLNYIQPSKYIVNSTQYSDDYSTPVLTAGDSFVLGYTDETEGIYNASKDNPIILFDDFTTSIQWVDFPFKVKSSACKIIVPKNNEDLRFFYYAIKAMKFDHSLHKRYWISEFSKQEYNDFGNINNKIAKELDNINSLINIKKKIVEKLDELIKSQFIQEAIA